MNVSQHGSWIKGRLVSGKESDGLFFSYYICLNFKLFIFLFIPWKEETEFSF